MAEQNNTEMESVAQERERMRSEESRLRRLKRKRQRRERAKRLLIAAFCLIIAVVIGLGVFIAGRFEKRAAENTLTLKSDGSIIFEEIEAVLYEFFILDIPSDLDALSTHTRVDDVHSVSIKEVIIQGGDLIITCSGMIGVSLQFGSDSEQESDDIPMKMPFPFKFKGAFRYNGNGYEVTECDDLVIDTDAFYA